MTIKTRNSLMKLFFIASLVCIGGILACFIAALISKSIVPPVDIRVPACITHIPLANYHFVATLLAITVLTLYVPVTFLLLFRYFENTQSTEVVFFCGVLLGVLCEAVRFLIPTFGLWQSYSLLLAFAGRIVLAGKLAVPLSFFAAATMSEPDQRQNVERNGTIIIALSVVIAITMPLNTAQITTTGMIIPGFSIMFAIVRFFIFCAAGVSFYINAHRHDSTELKQLAFFYIVLVIGYLVLTATDNFLFLGIGTPLLGIGTVQLLRNLHRLYMWK